MAAHRLERGRKAILKGFEHEREGAEVGGQRSGIRRGPTARRQTTHSNGLRPAWSRRAVARGRRGWSCWTNYTILRFPILTLFDSIMIAMSATSESDLIIIGGGIVGLATGYRFLE